MSEPIIHRARVMRLTLYEVTHAELDELERGSPASVQLNLAVALLSSAVSIVAALMTADVTDRAFFVFAVLSVTGFVVGGVLLVLSWKTRTVITHCIKTIRDRLPPPEGISEGPTLGVSAEPDVANAVAATKTASVDEGSA